MRLGRDSTDGSEATEMQRSGASITITAPGELLRSSQEQPITPFLKPNKGKMKLKYKGPNGVGLIQVPDDSSIGNVFDELATEAGVRVQAIKYGLPMAMKTVDSSQRNEPAATFKLNGESVIIVPEEISLPLGPTSNFKTSSNVYGDQAHDAGGVLVAWPERDGTMGEKHCVDCLYIYRT